MITHIEHECELCGTRYTSELEAVACEAQGWPEPLPWIRTDRKIPAFGENGVEWAHIAFAAVRGDARGHDWFVAVAGGEYGIHLSHNRDSEADGDWYPVFAFDPRYGYSMFRYESADAHLAVWAAAMHAYGFPFEEARVPTHLADRMRLMMEASSEPLWDELGRRTL